MKTANYNIRLDPEIKAKAEKTFANFGLNLSEAINVFLHTSILHCGFPFELRQLKPNSELLQAMEETEQIIKEYSDDARKTNAFANAHEMFSAMDIEDQMEGECE